MFATISVAIYLHGSLGGMPMKHPQGQFTFWYPSAHPKIAGKYVFYGRSSHPNMVL